MSKECDISLHLEWWQSKFLCETERRQNTLQYSGQMLKVRIKDIYKNSYNTKKLSTITDMPAGACISIRSALSPFLLTCVWQEPQLASIILPLQHNHSDTDLHQLKNKLQNPLWNDTSPIQTPTPMQSQHPLCVLHASPHPPPPTKCSLATATVLRASLGQFLVRNKPELTLRTQRRICQVKYLSSDLLRWRG